ncbi:hypothetical protein Tco_0926400 [Tanacetum coccineum]|uniref:Uncharacterized protein n=1 Tax=Tanacetum coccineum TaxID=301880 RepID=A0ABQ5D9N8_9ASTR
METALKRKSKKVLISESEGEESEDQGRKIQDIDDDPLVSLVRESIKDKSTDFVTPTKVSREAHEEEISPTILEAAKTLSNVTSQGVSKEKSTNKGKRYRRRARSVANNINIGLDVEEDINTGIKDVNIGSTKVDSGTASKRGQREGKAPMIEEDIQLLTKLKPMRQRGANWKSNKELQAQLDEEEDWDAIKAKLEANAELTKDDDFAKRMVDMINQRKKYFAEQKAKARRNKPMTQAEQRTYMATYLKNQGTWKPTQLKKLTFDELKTEFEKLVKSIENFVPIETDERVKRQGVQLEQEFSKKQKTIEEVSVLEESITKPVIAKEEEIEKYVKKRGQIRKQKARKGIHIDKTAQDESEEEREAFMKDKVTSASSESEIGIDAIPTATKPPSIGDLKTMFDPLLSDDAIWSLPLQQKMINWRYYPSCAVHCLTLDASTIYMLADRKYPLSKDACQVMLTMKLLDGTMDEVCYQLLKMIEKQAGLRL